MKPTESELELTFSDLVALVRDECSDANGDIGYARAAKIVDHAIKAQVAEAVNAVLARVEKEVIGEDDNGEIGDTYAFGARDRNDLRAKQRKLLQSLKNNKESK